MSNKVGSISDYNFILYNKSYKMKKCKYEKRTQFLTILVHKKNITK